MSEDIKESNNLIKKTLFVGVEPGALCQKSLAEYKTEPDSINIKDLIRLLTEYYLPKRNTYPNG